MSRTEEQTPVAGAIDARDERGRRGRLRELGVFLFLIVPSMVLSFFALRQGSASFDLTACAIILRDLSLVCLISFFLWRNREAMACIGWNPAGAGLEVLAGALLFLPFLVVTNFADRFFRSAGLSTPPSPLPQFLTATGWREYVLAALLVVVVAIAEETIFRGYLILRLEELTKSPLAAALLSAFFFSIGHGYEGTAGAATVFVMGFMLAAVYLWRRSLVAPIVIHFLQDFMGIVILPILAHMR